MALPPQDDNDNGAMELPNDDYGQWQRALHNEAADLVEEYGFPDSKEAMEFLEHVNFYDVLEQWASGSGGFTANDWASFIDNVTDIRFYPDGDGIGVEFDFSFESEDGYSGSRTGYASF